LKLENLVTNPNLTPIWEDAVRSNPVNNEVSAVLDFGATSEVASDCETGNDLNDGDKVDSVMLCVGVPGGGKDIFQGDSGGPTFDLKGTKVGVVSWGYGYALGNFPASFRVFPAPRIGSMRRFASYRVAILPHSGPD
jgi:secreted trypsin-like serine protease